MSTSTSAACVTLGKPTLPWAISSCSVALLAMGMFEDRAGLRTTLRGLGEKSAGSLSRGTKASLSSHMDC